MNMGAMLKQAQKMQADMEKKRAELDEREYEFSSGGGVINARVNGKKELLHLDIKPEAVDPDDIELMSDMIVAAVNGALRVAQEDVENEMKRLTGGAGIPGMF